MSTVKIKLTDAVSNYEADDLSLKAYVKGSLVLDIKVGGKWNYPMEYSVDYDSGEFMATIVRDVKNGTLEKTYLADRLHFNGQYMEMYLDNSEAVEVVPPPIVESVASEEVEPKKWPTPAVDLTLKNDKWVKDCETPEDCCGDPEDCVVDFTEEERNIEEE
jgi:hypothetical protein